MKPDILITGANGFIGRHLIGGKKFSGDICDIRSLTLETQDCEGIVHLAAVSDKRLFDANPYDGIYSNLLGLCNVLDCAKAQGLWVIFASTFQVRERHLYGMSKLMGEELCRTYAQKGVRVRIVRFPVVYGPGGRSEKLVTKMIEKMKNGIEPKIETNDPFYFSYVDDFANAIENEVAIVKEDVYGVKHTIRDLRDGIMECLKKEYNA
jgi:nucleoside-diphosphate-sugar epimerase